MAANAAILFHEDGYRPDRPRLMGRHAAGEGFPEGLLRHGVLDELVCLTDREARFRLFERIRTASGHANGALPRAWSLCGVTHTTASQGVMDGIAAMVTSAAAPADPVVRHVGRLSRHAKASPLPLYLGLDQAIRRLGRGRRVHLVEAGWHANDWIEEGFREAQRALAPSVRCHPVDGRAPRAGSS